MKKYKDLCGTPYGPASKHDIDELRLIEISDEEYDRLIAIREKNRKIAEAKLYLAETDYKMLPYYVRKPNEDLTDVIFNRDEKREFIRNAERDN